MSLIKKNLLQTTSSIPNDVTLVAVSKTKPIADLMLAYEAGQRVFGENKILEMVEKWETMPKDISWHMIGHVQTNKVKYMAPFVNLIHAVDSYKLLKEIDKQAKKHNRIINCLLQVKIAEEESKYGLDEKEIETLLMSEDIEKLANIKVQGLMGMATFTSDQNQIENEFNRIKILFNKLKLTNPELTTLSTGMSSDYKIAIQCGSNMVRIGSSIFGARNYG